MSPNINTDISQRRQFVNKFLVQNEVSHHNDEKVICGGDTHLRVHVDGFLSKQNCRFYVFENPHENHEKWIHPQRYSVVWRDCRAFLLMKPAMRLLSILIGIETGVLLLPIGDKL